MIVYHRSAWYVTRILHGVDQALRVLHTMRFHAFSM